jgi:hypothetical protein
MARLAALLLFGVFALCILSVLLTGATSYQRLTERDQSAYSRRTAAQYLTARIRQADRMGSVSVVGFGDGDALLIKEEIDGVGYETCVYCHGGALREMFTFAGEKFAPEDGEVLLPAQSLELKLEGQLLTAKITNEDGTIQELTLFLRSREGGLA